MKKFFGGQIPFFAISKMAKNQFLNWEKVLKLPKMRFHVKKILLIYMISRVYLPETFFKFSGLICNNQALGK